MLSCPLLIQSRGNMFSLGRGKAIIFRRKCAFLFIFQSSELNHMSWRPARQPFFHLFTIKLKEDWGWVEIRTGQRHKDTMPLYLPGGSSLSAVIKTKKNVGKTALFSSLQLFGYLQKDDTSVSWASGKPLIRGCHLSDR